MTDALSGKRVRLNGKIWTIGSPFPGISYHYLESEDGETIIRADALLHAEIYRFGGAV